MKNRKTLSGPGSFDYEAGHSLVDQAEAQMKALEQDPNMQMHEAEMLKAQPHMWTMIELGKMAQLTL